MDYLYIVEESMQRAALLGNAAPRDRGIAREWALVSTQQPGKTGE